MKIRFRFRKESSARWLSHLDLSRAWVRIFIRAGLPLAYSQGFNPHPKLAFSPALPVGISSESEYMDVEFSETVEAATACACLNEAAPRGLLVESAVPLPVDTKVPSLGASIAVADYRLNIAGLTPEEVKPVLTGHGITDKKEDGQYTVPALLGLEAHGGRTGVLIRAPVRFKPLSIVDIDGTGEGLPARDVRIDRTALWVLDNGCLVDPLTAIGSF